MLEVISERAHISGSQLEVLEGERRWESCVTNGRKAGQKTHFSGSLCPGKSSFLLGQCKEVSYQKEDNFIFGEKFLLFQGVNERIQ